MNSFISIFFEIYRNGPRVRHNSVMNTTDAAQCMESLGNEIRLTLFRELVKAGGSGLSVGDLQKRLDMPGSTLTHHVQHLEKRGLITQTREGRVLRCRASFGAIQALMGFLMAECCAEEDPCWSSENQATTPANDLL